MIIDTHTHFYDPTRPEGVPWPPADNRLLYRPILPATYRALAEPEGVTGTVVVEASKWQEDNQWILNLAQTEPIIVGFVGHLEPGQNGFSDQLARYAPHPLFCGIRCGSAYFTQSPKGRVLADLEALAANDLTLDVLIRAQEIDAVISLARSLPHLRIVVNHIAHMPIDGGAIPLEWIARYQRLAAEPEIRMKVSALPEQVNEQPAPVDLEPYHPTLDALWNAFGKDRLLYGSNWPVCERAGDFTVGLNVVKAYFSERGDEAYRSFFRENAATTYRFVDRESTG